MHSCIIGKSKLCDANNATIRSGSNLHAVDLIGNKLLFFKYFCDSVLILSSAVLIF